MEAIGAYLDLQLDSNFTPPQKDKIKLVLTYSLINKIETADPKSLAVKGIFSEMTTGIKSLVGKYSGKKDETEKVKNKVLGIFEIAGIKQFGKEFDKDIEKINKAQNNTNTFSKLGKIGKIISGEDNKLFKGKSEKQIKENIKTKVNDFGKKLKLYRGNGTKFLKDMDNTEVLGMNVGKALRGFISETIKEGGIMGTIVGFLAKLFFGSEFLDDVDNKKGKATENLKKSIKKDKIGILNNSKEEDVESLKPKDLEKFYKFLDGEKIDYSKDDFWEKLTTGKVDGKLLKIYNILTDNRKNKGILSGDELKGNKVQNFVKKLNQIPDIFEKKEVDDIGKEIKDNESRIAELNAKQNAAKKTESEIKKDSTPAVVDNKVEKKSEYVKDSDKSITIENTSASATDIATTVVAEKVTTKPKGKKNPAITETKPKKEEVAVEKIGLTEAEQKELDKLNKQTNKLKFEQSINKLTIPGIIIHPETGEKLDIKIEGKNIKLGKDTYGISIKAAGKERFKKVEFTNGKIILNGNEKEPINKNQIKKLLNTLLVDKKEFNFLGTTKYGLIDIKYDLNIKKIS